MPVIKTSFFLTAVLPQHHTQAHMSLRVSSFLKRDWHIYLNLITSAQAARVTTARKVTEYSAACFNSSAHLTPHTEDRHSWLCPGTTLLVQGPERHPVHPPVYTQKTLGWKGPDSSEQHKCVISVLWMGHPSLSTKSPAEFAYINL